MILMMCGRAGSGKDTVADILVRDHGFTKIGFADPLKRIVRDVYSFTNTQLWGPSAERNKPDPRYTRPEHTWRVRTWAELDTRGTMQCSCCGVYNGEERLDCCLTPRYALQQLGTEWGRACYPNTWIDLALRTAKILLAFEPLDDGGINEYPHYTAVGGLYHTLLGRAARGIVIADGRFPNEAAAVRAAGGVVWRTSHGVGLQGAAGQHESERHELEADAIVPDSPLEVLPAIITTMLHETGFPNREATPSWHEA